MPHTHTHNLEHYPQIFKNLHPSTVPECIFITPCSAFYLRDALDHHQAEPPNVRGPPVRFPVQPLGGHIPHRPDYCLDHRPSVVEFPGNAEIGQFYLVAKINKLLNY